MKRIIVTLFLCSFLSIPVQSTLYQVGPARPHTTLQSITALLLPGDIVEVDGDHTYSGGVIFTEPGSSENWITIRGLRINGNRPVISGGTNTIHFLTDWPYSGPGADYYIFEGFDITGGTSRGIYHQSANLIIRDTVVHECPQHGILGADEGSGSLTLDHVEVYGCGSGDSRHQIYMATDEVNRPLGSVFRMQFCYIHDGIGGNNVKTRAERNEIYYNWIEGAYYHELELIGPDGQDPELAREDSDVVGNVLWKRNDNYVIRAGGDGTGETFGRYRFVNNTIIAGNSAVFRLFDGIESIEMHNNVMYRNGTNPVTVMRTVDANWVAGEQISGQNNWIKTGSLVVPSQWIGTLSGATPGFDDLAGNNLRLNESSALLNAGTSTPASPPGYPFPLPLFPSQYHPPQHAVGLPGSQEPRFSDTYPDIGAYERIPVIYVDIHNLTGNETGTTIQPYSTIQSALDVALSGYIVCVAQGTYPENLVIDNVSLTLLGGFVGGSSVDYSSGTGGNFSSQDPVMNVSEIQSTSTDPAIQLIYPGTSGTTIDGFTISGGSRGIELDNAFTWPELTNVTITRNIIESNGVASGSHRGGGVYLSGDSHLIQNNTIRSNISGRGAGIYSTGLDITIDGNLIEDSIGYGDHAGGLNLGGTVLMTANVIRNNRVGEGLGYGWGGGVLILGTAYLSGNEYTGNMAPSIGGAIFVDEGGWAEIRNELIYANSTQAHDKGGAAIYVDGGAGPSHADIINCTVANNTAPGSTGGNGVYVEGDSSANVLNCIFRSNGSDDFYVSGDSELSVNFSCSNEVISGTGNLNEDPLFADPSGADYHLKSTAGRWDSNAGGGVGGWVMDSVHSLAIDAGDPASAFGGELAPNGGRINMGAYGNTAQASKSSSGPAVPAIHIWGVLALIGTISALMNRPGRSHH